MHQNEVQPHRLIHHLTKSPFTSQLCSPSPILPGSGSSASGSAWRPARCHCNSPCRSETQNNDLRFDIYVLESDRLVYSLTCYTCLLLTVLMFFLFTSSNIQRILLKQVSPCSCGWPYTSPCPCVHHKSAAAHETVERKIKWKSFQIFLYEYVKIHKPASTFQNVWANWLKDIYNSMKRQII